MLGLKIKFNLVILIFTSFLGYCQIEIQGEYLIGKTSDASYFFPEVSLNQTASISFSKSWLDETSNWVKHLNNPKTGINLEIANYGNVSVLGYSYAIHPFIELPIFSSRIRGLHLHTGLGMAYLTKKFEPNNWQSKAISTDLNWSFRFFLYYHLIKIKNSDTRIAFGYTHRSNGHTRWPNNGLNSFLGGVNVSFSNRNRNKNIIEQDSLSTKKTQTFYSLETGLGINSLSREYNQQNGVYSIGFSYGKIYNTTYKLGFGGYYRFYQNYYNHIKEERSLIEEYPELKKNAWYNASTFGLHLQVEILLNHVSIFAQLGVNFVKPFYKIDYRLVQETWINDEFVPGELDSKFWLKRFISGKLGLKYYLFDLQKSPKNNFSIGANIASNLGQADFSELQFSFIRILD